MAKKVATSSSTTAAVTTVAKKGNKKAKHPFIGKLDADKKPIANANWPFESLPKDYSHLTMSPLTKKDFKNEAGFFDYLASVYTAKAAAMTAKAEQSRTMGTGEDRKNAKRLAAVAAQTEALVAKLGGKIGADAVAKIIAAAQKKVQDDAAAAASKA